MQLLWECCYSSQWEKWNNRKVYVKVRNRPTCINPFLIYSTETLTSRYETDLPVSTFSWFIPLKHLPVSTFSWFIPLKHLRQGMKQTYLYQPFLDLFHWNTTERLYLWLLYIIHIHQTFHSAYLQFLFIFIDSDKN
jgi:hypothetical protein